jgi:3-oxoacyl-[acyl-carrier-protein] synthase II
VKPGLGAMTIAGRSIAVTGLGAVSPAGAGAGTLFEALALGRGFVARGVIEGDPGGEIFAAPVPALDAAGRIPPPRIRRLGRISRMALLAAIEAVEAAGLGRGELEAGGVVLGTGLGALADTMKLVEQLLGAGPSEASPSLFPTSVMNVAAAQVSMELGMRGHQTTVNHREVSGELAVSAAAFAIALGRADRILAGGVDELTPPVAHALRRLRALSSGLPRPYRSGRDGFAPGEGACVLVLEAEGAARGRGARVLARVAGIGLASAERPAASFGPGLDGGREVGSGVEAAVAAARAALEEAALSPGEVDLVVGAGCGSPGLDALEAQTLEAVFGDRAVAVTSPHGAIGTYMAAGALRVAAAVWALDGGRAFPTLTSGEADPAATPRNLLLPGAVAPAGGELRHALVLGSATGGASASIVLARGEPR